MNAMRPKLALCNIFSDTDTLRAFAATNGFSGVEWSFDMNDLPETPVQASRWVKEISRLAPLEVRYHCPFYQIDLGHDDPREAEAADALFRRIIGLVSKVGGRYLTIHIGLGRDTTEPLSWDRTIGNLQGLVQFGTEHRVRVCLENLAWGWTSRPDLFEKLIRKSGAGVTCDIGHAQVCESVVSQQFNVEDFVTPHPDRVFNAHIYHLEVSGRGHLPPEGPGDLDARLSVLLRTGCTWWVMEIHNPEELLQTKRVVEAFLQRRIDAEEEAAFGARAREAGLS